MSEQVKEQQTNEKIGIGAWIALIVMIILLSGIFQKSTGPLKVLDFTNLTGKFGAIGEAGNFLGKGGTGAKDGFLAGLNLIPGIMLFSGLLGVFEQFGAFKASEKLFRPILRPLLGIPGTAGIPFVSSFTSSDIAAFMTKDMYEAGEITDDERTIFTAFKNLQI